MKRQTKFQPLTDYLLNKHEEIVTLTFNQIEAILGFDLEKSYRLYRPNWANNMHERPYRACIAAGYKFDFVDMDKEVVRLIKTDATINFSKNAQKIKKHKTNGILITNEMIEEYHQKVKATSNYGREDNLITDCLLKFPKNTDVTIVAMKIGLIDITNSTHISQHKSKISAVELAECIVAIKDIDERIKNGDPEVVNEIARCNGNINLFSFASK
ncbi:MAG: hypothetical protein J6S04_00605 [Clostridia bacterium]|nr:hypothetical protein [Clostridia bacterium]